MPVPSAYTVASIEADDVPVPVCDYCIDEHYPAETFAELLAEAAVAQQLGHTDGGKLIEDLYGHPDAEQRRQVVAEAWASAPRSHHSPARNAAGGAA